MIALTRRYRFCASHRLHNVLLSEGENSRLYGKCNNPFGHGHDYELEVSIAGEVDPLAGIFFPLSHLDRLVNDCVIAKLNYRNLNVDVQEFQALVPTTENIAMIVAQTLQEAWSGYIATSTARLTRVYLKETDRNSFEVLLPVAPALTADSPLLETERVEGRVIVNA